MPVDFPNLPASGDKFTANGVTYQWDGTKWIAIGHTDPASSIYLPLAGGAMEGPLYLKADPVQPLEAATKQYVDANGGGSGVPPAPADGTLYGVKDGDWSNEVDAGSF
jgi:hypothetical protein